MSNDPITNDFIRECVNLAARFYNMEPPHHGAAAAVVNVARLAAESPQETAPLYHYAPDLRLALLDAYGHHWELADLSNVRQEEAVSAWMWYADRTGSNPDANMGATTISDAIAEMRIGGAGWRQRMRDALRRDFNRRDFVKPHLAD